MELDREIPLFEGIVPVYLHITSGHTNSPSNTGHHGSLLSSSSTSYSTSSPPSLRNSAISGSSMAPIAVSTTPLTIRVLNGNDTRTGPSGANTRQRVIYVEICDERDPFFLHHASTTETDYADLAAEQVYIL